MKRAFLLFACAAIGATAAQLPNEGLIWSDRPTKGWTDAYPVGNGLMGAAARGMRQAGKGHITGVIPSFFRDETIEAIFDDCDELIFTDTMRERKAKMEDLADAFLVVPGGIGTFEELFVPRKWHVL